MRDISKHEVKNFRAIDNFLISKGMPVNGRMGLIGNLHCESTLHSNNLQNSYNNKFGMTDEEYTSKVDSGEYSSFATDKGGYGLAQWTSSGRKQGLLDYVSRSRSSISDMTAQLEYLWYELTNAYKNVYKVLMDENSSLADCAKIVMLKFERPANQTEANQNVRVEYAQAYFDTYYKSSKVETEKVVTKKDYIMSASELVAKCEKLLTVPTLYVYGGLGGAMHDRNKNRYKGQYTQKASIDGNMFGFDCVGMIKSLLWGFSFSTDSKFNYGGACVPSNNVPNTGARKFFNDYCKEISNDWSSVLEGEAVWLDGNPDSHIAIYVGNGQCIECTPRWKNGVQKTQIRNMGRDDGCCRTWLYHGKLPWIDYSNSTKSVIIKEEDKTVTYVVKKGDTLIKIAKAYGKDYRQIAKDNNIANPSLINIGQKLIIK